MYHYIYQINVGRKFYIGKHSSKQHPKKDYYTGSGLVVRRYRRMFGTKGLKKIILETCWSEEHANRRESEIVTWNLVNQKDCLNRVSGGYGMSSENAKLFAKSKPRYHGLSKTGTYAAWKFIKQFKKGMFCKDWSDFNKFQIDMGEKPDGATKSVTLQRHDDSLPYCKENCYWKKAGTPCQDQETGKQTKSYYAWADMRRKHKGMICKDWLNDFSQFNSDMGERSDGARFLRHDDSLPFSKENCFWKVVVPTQDPKTGKPTPTYRTWRGMRENNKGKVCKEWLSDYSQFHNDMGDKAGTLKRHDKALPYSKENCFWGSKK